MSIEDGAELKNARIKKLWSQRILAWKIGCTQQYVAQMEKGAKPLSDKALAFIEDVTASLNPYLGIGSEKTEEKVVKKMFKHNDLALPECPDIVQFDEVTDFSEDEDINRWEKWWFKDKNGLCLKCSGRCKQSSYVQILGCPQFKEKINA